MRIRIRIDELTPSHARVTIFEGREHGPNLGELSMTAHSVAGLAAHMGYKLAANRDADREGYADVVCPGDTFEAYIDPTRVVRREGMTA